MIALRDTKRERQEKATKERVRVWGRAAFFGELGMVGEGETDRKGRGNCELAKEPRSPNRNKLRSGFACEFIYQQHRLGT